MKKQNKKHQNTKSIDKKLKTKGLMSFVSLFSCNLKDFKLEILYSCIFAPLKFGLYLGEKQ